MSNQKKVEQYDHMLLNILQREGSIEGLMDAIFGFLYRKTDYFCVMTEKTQKYGFPNGEALKLAWKAYKKYEQMKQDDSKASKSSTNTSTSSLASSAAAVAPAAAAPSAAPSAAASSDAIAAPSAAPAAIASDPNVSVVPAVDPKTLTQEYFQSNPESFNGAIRENYSWSQAHDTMEIVLKVPKYVKRAKQVFVEIKRNHITVKIPAGENTTDMKTLVDDELHREASYSTWSLESGKEILVTLEKARECWWLALVTSEEKIDLQKIKPETKMENLDEEEQACLNKLKFDEHQKRLGKPQSHELKAHEMLKKGWDCEGSPFKGQQFDPKMFNVASGSG